MEDKNEPSKSKRLKEVFRNSSDFRFYSICTGTLVASTAVFVVSAFSEPVLAAAAIMSLVSAGVVIGQSQKEFDKYFSEKPRKLPPPAPPAQ